ncbi:leucine-rich repeat and coiled-coil domain-containing protein 1-like [Dysidea avara]|uniref:leucine-rich repeat and coiled-coil domain-containing protein 1-like n=1 Tax=Dysidea avara TaxID=196820 RepID=UPI0033244B4F
MDEDSSEVDEVIDKLSGPGLAEYLDFLETSSSPARLEEQQATLHTPHIDQVLSSYHERGSASPPNAVQTRLVVLEQQLASLLKRSEQGLTPRKTATANSAQKKRRSSCDPSTSSDARRQDRERYVSSHREDRRKRMTLMRNKKVDASDNSTQLLTKELDNERERRWKAEQAARKLIDHIRLLQASEEEQRRKHELALSRVMRLEQELARREEAVQGHSEEATQLKAAMTTMKNQFSELRSIHDNQLKVLEETRQTNKQHLDQWEVERTKLLYRAKDNESQVCAAQKEVGLLRRTVKQLRQQLTQVQELLTNRELEHRKQLEEHVGGKEVRQVIDDEVAKQRHQMDSVVEEYKIKLSEQHQMIAAMETEFRSTLANENSRYQELDKLYKSLQEELQASHDTAVMATQREQKSTCMVADLTAMVKEQRGRIVELNKCKQECVAEYKERIVTLESEVAIKCRLQAEVNTLQEEHLRVKSQLSMLEGLKEEKKLWQQELAQQGASLAQDRGRMQAKLEALDHEVLQLNNDNVQLKDQLRVQHKICDDHNDSILQLKQALAAKDHQIQQVQEACQQQEQDLCKQLEEQELVNQDLQEQLEELLERKEQLKLQLRESREECSQWEQKHKQLHAEWQKRVGLVSGLEDQVILLRDNYQQREASLVAERDQALQQARSAMDKLSSCDVVFRQQLEAKQSQHKQSLEEAVRNKELEVVAANNKVVAMETEMKELLVEIAAEKKLMEEKMQKLSAVFHELQPM